MNNAYISHNTLLLQRLVKSEKAVALKKTIREFAGSREDGSNQHLTDRKALLRPYLF